MVWGMCWRFERFVRFVRFERSMKFNEFIMFNEFKRLGFRKVGAAFPYFLFLVSYSLFPCVIAPLRALRETKNFVPSSLRTKKSQSENESESE
jgi:hypothetical protein